jgi:hypothetical protein
MCHIAPSLQRAHPHVPENHRVLTNNNMVIVSHPPYSPDSAHCDFVLLAKLKMKLKGRRFETMSDIQRESQAVLDSIEENHFHGAFVAGKDDAIAVYVPKELF